MHSKYLQKSAILPRPRYIKYTTNYLIQCKCNYQHLIKYGIGECV